MCCLKILSLIRKTLIKFIVRCCPLSLRISLIHLFYQIIDHTVQKQLSCENSRVLHFCVRSPPAPDCHVWGISFHLMRLGIQQRAMLKLLKY